MAKKKLMLLGGISYLIPAIKAAQAHGIHTITVDYLPDNIAHKYSDEYHTLSIIDKDAVLLLAQELKIDGIVSFAVDPGVVTAAYIAEKMGLPFQCSYESACILQDKAKFRKFLSQNDFNTPKAKGYKDLEQAKADAGKFKYPVIVKPVDSAGSKGVSKVESRQYLSAAAEKAIKSSLSKSIIIEEFLDLKGYQSSADCFTVDGKLVYSDFSDQLFDIKANNPYTPALEIWPSSMEKLYKDKISAELQRLFTLLNCKTGIYNVESRVCTNGDPYIMEVSPRGGGNRIAEIQRLATGIDLIENEVLKAIGEKTKEITQPNYNYHFVNLILHCEKEGTFKHLEIDNKFKINHVLECDIRIQKGDHVNSFTGANTAIGSLFLKFSTREELDRAISNQDDWLKIYVE